MLNDFWSLNLETKEWNPIRMKGKTTMPDIGYHTCCSIFYP